MKIVAIAVLIVLVLSLSAFAAPVCKDINTGTVMECPADSGVMPWDQAPGIAMSPERQQEWAVFFTGLFFIVALII